MINYENKNYGDFLKSLYRNLKISNNFITKIIYGYWQKTDIYKQLKLEEKKILNDSSEINIEIYRKRISEWNKIYWEEYKKFLIIILDSIGDVNDKDTVKLKDYINTTISNIDKKSKMKKYYDDLTISRDIIVKSDDVNLNKVNISSKENFINKFKENHNKFKGILNYQSDDVKELKNTNVNKNITIDNNNNNTLNEDDIKNEIYHKDEKTTSDTSIGEIKDTVLEETLSDDDMKSAKPKINLRYEDDNINNFKYVSNGINSDLQLSKYLSDQTKKVIEFQKEFENRRKSIYNKNIKLSDKSPNFVKQINNIKQKNISSFDVIIKETDEVIVHKNKDEIIIELIENQSKVERSLTIGNKEPKKERQIPLPIKIIRTKKDDV